MVLNRKASVTASIRPDWNASLSSLEVSMDFNVENLESTSPFVESIWSSQSTEAGSFTSLAVSTSELVFTRTNGTTTINMRGPESRATIAPGPANSEFFGITFKLGAYLPSLPPTHLLDRHATLPTIAGTFWLDDHALPIPGARDADDFVERLVHLGLLRSEPTVEPLLRNEFFERLATVRTIQRRFVQATGLSHRAVQSIERARRALVLLEAGRSIADVVHDLGYADQPHLTKMLRHLVGRTPARIANGTWMHAPLTPREIEGQVSD
jgi:Helix-turn-helix domain